MGKLAGKIASILGAAGKGNMGQTIARRLAAEGAKVVVSGRHADELKSLAAEINGDWTLCDITDQTSLTAMVDAITQKHGRLDIAVNATGWGLLKPFQETTEEELQAMLDLQFKGPFQWLQKIAPAMAAGNGGSIIQISSATATIMLDNHAAYMGTKAGIDHVMRCVANEFGARGVRANSISPGLTETPMTAGTPPAMIKEFTKGYPLGRIGTSDDIAAAAVFLAADDCFMTGQNLQVNGGLTLRRNPNTEEIMASLMGGEA